MELLAMFKNGAGLTALMLTAVWPASVVAGQPGNQASSETISALEAIMRKDISDTTPGCVVGIHAPRTDVLRAYGQADLERHVANTVDSVFNLASASKQFTAAATLLLANEGKLSLDDDIRKFLPELPKWDHPITVDNLLNHTSGLRDFRFTDWLTGRDTLAQGNPDILAYAARQKSLNHVPGQSHSYTNTGYVLLAIIIERVSGQSFADFTRDRLFVPAGMTRTGWEVDSQQLVDQRAMGYALAEPAQGERPAKFIQMPTARNTVGHGNLLSTASDMQRWNAALSRNAFGPKLTTQLEEPARLANGFVIGYARGEFVGKYRGLREIQHGGYNGIYTAWIGRFPEVDVSMSLLCNGDADNVSPHDLIDLFLPETLPELETSQSGDSKDLSVYSGVYRHIDSDQVSLLAFPSQAKRDGTRFVMGPYTYEFPVGHPERITRHTYGNSMEWTRVPEWTPAASTLNTFQGRFTSDELLASYDISLDGQQLKLSLVGLSALTASLQPRAKDIFETQGLPQMQGILVRFKRDETGRILGLSVAPDGLHELPFRKVEAPDPVPY